MRVAGRIILEIGAWVIRILLVIGELLLNILRGIGRIPYARRLGQGLVNGQGWAWKSLGFWCLALLAPFIIFGQFIRPSIPVLFVAGIALIWCFSQILHESDAGYERNRENRE